MKKQHCVVMDDKLSQELKIVAIKMGISMSDLIRRACLQYLVRRDLLLERGLIFDDARDVKAALDAKAALNARYGEASTNYVDTDNPEGL